MTANKFWFPKKRYGWGWGLPNAWQGWLVLSTYFLFQWIGVYLIRTHDEYRNRGFVFIYFGLFTLALILIIWLKGERSTGGMSAQGK